MAGSAGCANSVGRHVELERGERARRAAVAVTRARGIAAAGTRAAAEARRADRRQRIADSRDRTQRELGRACLGATFVAEPDGSALSRGLSTSGIGERSRAADAQATRGSTPCSR